MLASMMFNPTLDGQDQSGSQVLANYYQWICGTSNVIVDFGTSLFNLTLAGTATGAVFDYWTDPLTRDTVIKAGATFSATGNGSINMVNFGGFKGAFTSASLQESRWRLNLQHRHRRIEHRRRILWPGSR